VYYIYVTNGKQDPTILYSTRSYTIFSRGPRTRKRHVVNHTLHRGHPLRTANRTPTPRIPKLSPPSLRGWVPWKRCPCGTAPTRTPTPRSRSSPTPRAAVSRTTSPSSPRPSPAASGMSHPSSLLHRSPRPCMWRLQRRGKMRSGRRVGVEMMMGWRERSPRVSQASVAI
jgi:hypothetical protein